MKKLFILFALSIFSSPALTQTTEDLFVESEYEYIYLGIDFSIAKFQGEFIFDEETGEQDMNQIKEVYFDRWNNLILKEKEKYDIAGAMRKPALSYDIDAIAFINSRVKVEDMYGGPIEKKSKEDIQNHLSGLEFKSDKDIGFLFVVEYFSKTKVRAAIHFVAFKLENNEILLHERYIGVPKGFGLRNFWGRSFYETIEQIDGQYRKWRRIYKKE